MPTGQQNPEPMEGVEESNKEVNAEQNSITNEDSNEKKLDYQKVAVGNGEGNPNNENDEVTIKEEPIDKDVKPGDASDPLTTLASAAVGSLSSGQSTKTENSSPVTNGINSDMVSIFSNSFY